MCAIHARDDSSQIDRGDEWKERTNTQNEHTNVHERTNEGTTERTDGRAKDKIRNIKLPKIRNVHPLSHIHYTIRRDVYCVYVFMYLVFILWRAIGSTVLARTDDYIAVCIYNTHSHTHTDTAADRTAATVAVAVAAEILKFRCWYFFSFFVLTFGCCSFQFDGATTIQWKTHSYVQTYSNHLWIGHETIYSKSRKLSVIIHLPSDDTT